MLVNSSEKFFCPVVEAEDNNVRGQGKEKGRRRML